MIYLGEPKYFANNLFDFILPRFCCSCKTKLLVNQDTMCVDCLSKIQRSNSSRLKREFERKFMNNKIIREFYSPFVFEKDKELQHAIHALKYDKKFPVGIFLGKVLAAEIKSSKTNWKFDLIIPIPLHQLKKAERGYNQAYYIAKGVGKIFKVKVSDRSVKRIKYTESQTTMNLNEREENISGAFKVKWNTQVRGKNILLLDDVITTGATISECGKILLEAGANKIYAASVAIAD
ncbi:MAG: ComF family protein [Ignavibacteriales bacterium]|nr:MAG: ComF family protein [Ignavibacteriales bacterium]